MIINMSKVDETIVDNMRGGEGKVVLNKIKDLPQNVSMYAKITLRNGDSIGVHTHIENSEIIYVLKGEALVIDDGKSSLLREGDVNICLANHSHSIVNNQCEEFVALACVIKE